MTSILVINDDPVQLHLLASILERDQFTTTRFLCSKSAWQWLQEGHRPDAIVLDLHMPGISGWRFCELLHSHAIPGRPVPPVLAVSATYTGIDTQEVLRDLGASAFLPLPAEPSVLRQHVRLLVDCPPQPYCPHVWMISSNEPEIQRIRHVFAERGWQVVGWQSGAQVRANTNPLSPDILIIEEPLSDVPVQDIAAWCKHQFPQVICILLGNHHSGEKTPSSDLTAVDVSLPKGCDPLTLLSACEKGRWERALSRVEHLLDLRTDDLRESEAQFKNLFESLPDILVIYDEQHMVTHVNAVGAEQLEFRPEELIGQPFSLIRVRPDERPSSQPRRGGDVSTWQESRLRQKHGHHLCVEIMERSVRFQGRDQTLFVARDLTERKLMEQENATLEHQLRQVQKMEAIGRLASGVAHDMNNILTAILGHASLCKLQSEAGQALWRAGDVIEKAVRRGKELTSHLLGFARQGKHHHVTVDLHDLIQEVEGLLQRTFNKTIAIKTELAAGTPCVVGDPNQLFQILMNLAVNACDAMGDKGECLIQTVNEHVSPEQASHVPGLYAGDYVLIRVSDTGPGIPLDIQSHIFEPFFTTKEQGKGTGMGLAMVYGIVKNHRGYIGVTSTLGGGTTMRVYLPSAPCLAAQKSSKTEKSLVQGTGHILVVDDEQDVAEAAQAILEYLGYRVTVKLNGNEGVLYCQDLRNRVDMVLLDMVMTDMSGTECFTRLRMVRPDVKIILCTGYDRNHAVQDLVNQGVAGFIQKPYEVDELAHMCAHVMEEGMPAVSALSETTV